MNLNDPDGDCPVCPFLAKGATAAVIDYFLQGTVNLLTGMDVKEAFHPDNIDKTDVALSALEGALPWSVPGGKYGKAAAVAVADVGINAGKAALNGEEYGFAEAGQDFVIGFESQLGAEKMGDFLKGKTNTKNKEGVIYLRKEESGNLKDYVGQAKSDQRYLRRQKEHAKDHPDSDFEFDIIDRGDPNGKFPTDLDKREQKHLDKRNGPTNKSNLNGGTSNKKNIIKKKKK